MTDRRTDEEMRLIDLLRGELSEPGCQEVLDRLGEDESLRHLHADLSHTFAALAFHPEVEPPEDLTETTIARIQQVRRTEALLAREESRHRGGRPTFSLRELAVAAVAVTILLLVLVPSVRQGRQLAAIVKCTSHVSQIGVGMLAYANANDDCLPSTEGPQERWLPAPGAKAFSNSAALYKLVRMGYMAPAAFRCPAGGEGEFKTAANMIDFPAQKYVGYSYQYSRNPRGIRQSDPTLAAVANSMAILADSTPIFVGGRFRPERLSSSASDNHVGRGQNVLYLDMHVAWADRADVGVSKDNIFLVAGVSQYRGVEEPSSPTDTFLLPNFPANDQQAGQP